MKKKTASSVLWFVLAALLVPGSASSGCHRPRSSQAIPEAVDLVVTWKLDQALDRLEATEAQRQEFHAAKDWILEEIHDLIQGTRDTHLTLVEELKKDEPDAEKLHALVAHQAERHRIFAHDLVETVLSLHSTLSSGQRERIFELVADHMERMQGSGFHHPFEGSGRPCRFKERIHRLLEKAGIGR